MATYDIQFYAVDPLGIFSNTINGFGTWSGPTTPDATGTITDNGAGAEGTSLDDITGETATIDAIIGGTSTTGDQIYAEEVWTLFDPITGATFQVATLRINSGANTGWYTYSELPLVNGRSYQTLEYTETPEIGVTSVFDYNDYIENFDPGVVQGNDNDNVLDENYVGDPDGDRIDDIEAGSNLQFNWTDYADETNLEGGVTQNTGGVNVQVTYEDLNAADEFSAETNETIYVAPGEPFSTTSAAYMFGAGAADDTTLTFDFAAVTGSGFDDEVQNVQFRISDIDGIAPDGVNNFQDIVRVQAFDADGNPVDVTITGGSNHTVDPVTGTITASLTNFSPANAQASALIEIAGPVAQIVITYDNGGDTQQAIYFSDIHFETISETNYDDTIDAGGGDDVITGGEGADTITAGAGDDTINVGVGDTASGNDGNDTFVVDTGEIGGGTITVVGGSTGEDATGDTLDFNGQLQYGTLTTSVDPTDPDAFTGSATLLDGTVVNFSNIENILCFTDGMMIDTPFGPRLIEDLVPGDLVLTRDSGPQVLRWHGSRSLVVDQQHAPIEFAAGLLGNARAFRVSPQHRMLNEGYRAQLYFGQEEVLVPAKSLINGSTVRQLAPGPVTYHHLLFDKHEIVTCDGIASESYHPGHYSLPGIDEQAREDLFRYFPELRSDPSAYGDAARFSVKAGMGQVLAA